MHTADHVSMQAISLRDAPGLLCFLCNRCCTQEGDRPVAGSVVCTQSVILARGDSGCPLGLKSWVGGSVRGSSLSCTAFASCIQPDQACSLMVGHHKLHSGFTLKRGQSPVDGLLAGPQAQPHMLQLKLRS